MVFIIEDRSALKDKFGYRSAMAVPRLQKIVVSMASAGRPGQEVSGHGDPDITVIPVKSR